MKITLEATAKIETVNGQRCRVWTGKTESGIHIAAWIALIGAQDGDDAELERELEAVSVERELVRFDMRVAL